MKSLVSGKKKSYKTPDEADWEKIATSLAVSGCLASHCQSRFDYLKRPQAVGKGPWSASEDEKIVAMVSEHGKVLLYAMKNSTGAK